MGRRLPGGGHTCGQAWSFCFGRTPHGPHASRCPSPVPSELFRPHGGRVTPRHPPACLGEGPTVALLSPRGPWVAQDELCCSLRRSPGLPLCPLKHARQGARVSPGTWARHLCGFQASFRQRQRPKSVSRAAFAILIGLGHRPTLQTPGTCKHGAPFPAPRSSLSLPVRFKNIYMPLPGTAHFVFVHRRGCPATAVRVAPGALCSRTRASGVLGGLGGHCLSCLLAALRSPGSAELDGEGGRAGSRAA